MLRCQRLQYKAQESQTDGKPPQGLPEIINHKYSWHCCYEEIFIPVLIQHTHQKHTEKTYFRLSSRFSPVGLFATPRTVAHQAPLSMGFSRQEDWSGLPFPSPGDLPHPGIKSRSPASWADSLPSTVSCIYWMLFCINQSRPQNTREKEILLCPLFDR